MNNQVSGRWPHTPNRVKIDYLMNTDFNYDVITQMLCSLPSDLLYILYIGLDHLLTLSIYNHYRNNQKPLFGL